MKKACLVLRKTIDITDTSISVIIDAFSNCGYAFDEVRFLPLSQENALLETLKSMKKQYVFLLVLTDSVSMPSIALRIEELFGNATPSTTFGEAKAYQDRECLCFLLCADKEDCGKELVENACVPYMEKSFGLRLDNIILRSVGASASRVESLIAEVNQLENSAIFCSHQRKFDEDIIRITYDATASKMLVDDVLRNFAEGLGDTLYAMNDVSLEEQVVSILKLRHKKLSVA